MTINQRAEVLEVLNMPMEEFLTQVAPAAKEVHRTHRENKLTVTSMMGYTNFCKNQCLYCGLRAANRLVPRYRLEPETVLEAVHKAHETGFKRLFLISGEDPKYGFDKPLQIVRGAKEAGMEWISLACGEYDRDSYQALKEAGADEYVLKFEMSDPDTFNRLNPSTDFKKRMEAIHCIKELGFALASGNIVDFPGHSLEQMADDIMLMKELDVSWAPIVPYMPAKGTPLASEGGPGRQELILKEISLVRLMLPNAYITGGQPGKNPADGFASEDGNLAALAAGADLLFADLLPAAKAQDFRVVDHRALFGVDHIQELAKKAGMTFTF